MINWGFIGAGSIARSNLAPAVHHARGAVLHAVSSRDPSRAAALDATRAYTDYRALLDDPDVDVVYVALHNSSHREWAEEALHAGKHVVCEKPLTLSAKEVDSLAGTAEASGKLLVEAAWNRWHPRTREMESLLSRGDIGDIRHVSAYFDGPTPAVGNYRFAPELGGGALYDVGYYAISAALAAHGWQEPLVRDVRRERWSADSADRMTSFMLDFPGGGTADVFSGLTGKWVETFAVQGTAGEIQLLDRAFTAGAQPSRMAGTIHAHRFSFSYPEVDPYLLMVEEVTRAAQGEPAYLVPLHQSHAIAKVMDGVRAAV